jgi:transcriptional regulator with XRE-family HTH domain
MRSNKQACSGAPQTVVVDDQRVGALVRVLRIRRGLRQVDVARLAGVSDQTVSRIERGELASLSVAMVRRVARVLEARLDLRLWTRAGEVERLASASHSALVESLLGALRGERWITRPEVSFNFAGERGLVDIAAWHPATRSLLLIEVKTEIVDVGETIGTFDRKRRLGPRIAAQLGFDPATVAAALVIADTRTNHRRVQAHAATFASTLPDSGQRFRSFLRRPTGALAAVAFWPNRHPGSARPRAAGARRVRRPTAGDSRARPSVAGRTGGGSSAAGDRPP